MRKETPFLSGGYHITRPIRAEDVFRDGTRAGGAEKESPFIQFAVLYACSSATIVFLLHRFRVKNAA
jgi:hypothetical protein